MACYTGRYIRFYFYFYPAHSAVTTKRRQGQPCLIITHATPLTRYACTSQWNIKMFLYNLPFGHDPFTTRIYRAHTRTSHTLVCVIRTQPRNVFIRRYRSRVANIVDTIQTPLTVSTSGGITSTRCRTRCVDRYPRLKSRPCPSVVFCRFRVTRLSSRRPLKKNTDRDNGESRSDDVDNIIMYIVYLRLSSLRGISWLLRLKHHVENV